MDKELVSVIIPVYNVEKYLEKCLKSVIEQTYNKLEILLINDGSTDNSAKIIDSFCAVHSEWMCCYTKKNGGLSDVKNFGLKKARGEYVIFLDSDDYIEPEMYEKMLNFSSGQENAIYDPNAILLYSHQNG